MSHVSVKKTSSCYNQRPGFSFRSCYGSVLLDRSLWPCGLSLLLRVGSASGFPEACPQVLSPSATTRQAPWRGKNCAYLWRRAPPRARPRDVRSWQQEASVDHGFLMGCFNRTRRRFFFPTSPLVRCRHAHSAGLPQTFSGKQLKTDKGIVLGALPLRLLLFFVLGLLSGLGRPLAGAPFGLVPFLF